MLKSILESELVDGMHKTLIKQANNQNLDNLEQAVDHLNSAIDIFEDQGLSSQADKVLNVLYKIAKKHKKPKRPDTVPNGHTINLNPEKMVENLKEHGIVFDLDLNDDIDFDDDINLNIDEVQFLETFEDELRS